MNTGIGRSDRIRTCGIDVPNVARYQLRHTPICIVFSDLINDHVTDLTSLAHALSLRLRRRFPRAIYNTTFCAFFQVLNEKFFIICVLCFAILFVRRPFCAAFSSRPSCFPRARPHTFPPRKPINTAKPPHFETALRYLVYQASGDARVFVIAVRYGAISAAFYNNLRFSRNIRKRNLYRVAQTSRKITFNVIRSRKHHLIERF